MYHVMCTIKVTILLNKLANYNVMTYKANNLT